MNYKKWWQSKINWVQFFGIVGQVVVWFGGVVPPELLESASATMAGVQASITIIMRTWFTRTPIEQSVK